MSNKKNGNEMFDDIFGHIKGIFEPLMKSQKEMELAAIWITPAYLDNGKRKARYCAGDNVKLVAGYIADHNEGDSYTHSVVGCYGTIDSSVLNMMLMDLKTNETLILKIK